MALFKFSVLLVSVLCIAHVSCDVPLSSFGRMVESFLPEETYNKIFNFHVDGLDNLVKGLTKGQDNLEEKTGFGVDDALKQQFGAILQRLGVNGFTPTVLFTAKVNSLGKLLMEVGKLGNGQDMAQKFVDALNESAKSVTSGDSTSSFTALTSADAAFLKSTDLNTEENLNKFGKNFNDVVNEF